MLTTAITQADVDNETVFEMRSGGTEQIASRSDAPDVQRYPWVSRCHGLYQPNGVRFDGTVPEYDLIARITKEPDMSAQVTVEDRRQPAENWRRFGDMEAGVIYELSGLVYRKVSATDAERLTGEGSPTFAYVMHSLDCKVLHDVRLRMVLEKGTTT